jgi:excinuclease ABC subunit C
MIPSYIDKSKLPNKSGVYQFLNDKKEIIYVGKAINLYHRVASYFNRDVSGKTAVLVSQIKDVQTIVVESELEALILEANLIKKYRPQFNIRLMDDKDYLYIAVTKEEFPKVITVRKQDLKSISKYFGPFPSSSTVRDTLKLLRRVFPWCSNPPGPKNKNSRACFYYHIKLCPGACVGQISKEEYNKTIKLFTKFLDGKKEQLVEEISDEMFDLSKKEQFEEAGKLKKILSGIAYLTQTNRSSIYLQNPNFLQDETKQSLTVLQKDLNLNKLPERIEGYDISNIGGKEAVGSLVVLTNGEIDKSQYRKFKIRISGKPNDVGMHKEMMGRRLNHPEWPFPDLIIIDGGRGQVRGVYEQLKAKNIQIPIFGLAKRMEWLYPPEGEIIKLPKKSLSLRLLQKLRDESHRFAITYHRKLRDIIKV